MHLTRAQTANAERLSQWTAAASLLASLGFGSRLLTLEILAEGPRVMTEISERIGIAPVGVLLDLGALKYRQLITKDGGIYTITPRGRALIASLTAFVDRPLEAEELT